MAAWQRFFYDWAEAPPGTTYTKAGSAAVEFAASAPRGRDLVKVGAGLLAFTASAARGRDLPKVGTAILTGTGSGEKIIAEAYILTGEGHMDLEAAGERTTEMPRAGAGLLEILAVGEKAITVVDSGTGITTLAATGAATTTSEDVPPSVVVIGRGTPFIRPAPPPRSFARDGGAALSATITADIEVDRTHRRELDVESILLLAA